MTTERTLRRDAYRPVRGSRTADAPQSLSIVGRFARLARAERTCTSNAAPSGRRVETTALAFERATTVSLLARRRTATSHPDEYRAWCSECASETSRSTTRKPLTILK